MVWFGLRHINHDRLFNARSIFIFQTIHSNIITIFVYTQLKVTTGIFQTIHFNISIQFSSIWPLDRVLSGATTPGQSRPGNGGIEGLLCITQSSSITRSSPSYCLVSYAGHSFWESYLTEEMCCIAMNNYTYTYTDSCRNTTTRWRRATQFFRKIYLSFYWKGCVWEGVGDRIELQHIDPHSYGHNSVSFSFSWAAQPGAWGPSLSGTWSSFQHLLSNWSKFQLLNRESWGPPLLGAGSLYSIISLTDWLPVFTRVI